MITILSEWKLRSGDIIDDDWRDSGFVRIIRKSGIKSDLYTTDGECFYSGTLWSIGLLKENMLRIGGKGFYMGVISLDTMKFIISFSKKIKEIKYCSAFHAFECENENKKKYLLSENDGSNILGKYYFNGNIHFTGKEICVGVEDQTGRQGIYSITNQKLVKKCVY